MTPSPRPINIAAAAALCVSAASQSGCNLTASWVDRDGNQAVLFHALNGTLSASSWSDAGWATAVGFWQGGAGDEATMSFGGQPALSATVESAGCGTLLWSNAAVWSRFGAPDAVGPIKTVYLVMMTHLDVGFTDLAHGVCEKYFQQALPLAVNLSQALRALGGEAQYAYTTHPFLLAEYLDGAANCSYTPRTPADVAMLEAAIGRGDIRWHGKLANLFPELMDAAAFASSLETAAALNARYGRAWGATTAKSTDVPGLSRAVIPILARAGLRAVHIGYNSACKDAAVPQAFLWRHAESGAALLTLVNNNYGSTVYLPGMALQFLYTMDNGLPPSVADVQAFWAATQARFPNATLRLSSLDEFAEAALAAPGVAGGLAVVTQEVGDSWLYGAPADPWKLAAFRELRRARNEAVAAGALSPQDPSLLSFERRILIAGPEHNWGLSVGQYLPGLRSPAGNWSNALFHAVMNRSDYRFLASGWQEKRDFLTPLPPAGAAPPTPQWAAFAQAAADRIAALAPALPDLAGFSPVAAPAQPQACGRLSVAFNASDGSLLSLRDAGTAFEWVSPLSQAASGTGMLRFSYQTFTLAAFDAFNRDYNPGCGPPCGDFSKQGMDSAAPVGGTWQPQLVTLYRRAAAGSASAKNAAAGAACEFVAHLQLAPTLVTDYGAAAGGVWVNISVDADAASINPLVAVQVQWFGKTPTRLAEAAWLSFTPNVNSSSGGSATAQAGAAAASGAFSAPSSLWRLDVMDAANGGTAIDPLDVIVDGTRHVHAIWDGFSFGAAPAADAAAVAATATAAAAASAAGPYFRVQTLDAPLVGVGDIDHLLSYDGRTLPDPDAGGVHVNLHNNLWGTAFPQWYGDDARFRFLMTLSPPQAMSSAAVAEQKDNM